jgi:nucleoside-diphosphate-sugar epimerase
MSGRVIVLGAAGNLGRAAAESFRDAGWSVAGFVRGRSAPRLPEGVEPVEVDVRDRGSVVAAADKADVVLHALNPPYADWPALAMPFAETAVAAARAAGATLMFPGNVYPYGEGMPSILDEETPQQPTSRKGAIRAAVEARLRAAAGGDMHVVVLRAGDFFGGDGSGWFDRVIVKDLGRGRLVYPGPLDAVHEWAYLPDLADAFVLLAGRRAELPAFTAFGFPGHAVTGREFCGAIARIRGRALPVGGMPWRLLRMLSPFVPIFGELSEMAYLWRVPHRIDGAGLEAVIGAVPHTPLDAAVAASLHDLAATPIR